MPCALPIRSDVGVMQAASGTDELILDSRDRRRRIESGPGKGVREWIEL